MRSFFAFLAAMAVTTPATAQEVGGLGTDAQSRAISQVEAQPEISERESEARAVFTRGREAWNDTRYARAVELFNQAYALSPHPMMLINIGNAWLQLEQRDDARAAYERYLETAPRGASEREDVQTQLALIDARAAAALDPPEALPEPNLRVAGEEDETPVGSFEPLDRHLWTWVALGGTLAATAFAGGLWADAERRFGTMSLTCGATAQGCGQGAVSGLASELEASQVALGFAIAGVVATVILWVAEGLP